MKNYKRTIKSFLVILCILCICFCSGCTATKKQEEKQEPKEKYVNVTNQDSIMDAFDSLEDVEKSCSYIVKGYVKDEKIEDCSDKHINYLYNTSMSKTDYEQMTERKKQQLLLDYDENAFEDIVNTKVEDIQDVYTLRTFVVTKVIKNEGKARQSLYWNQDRREAATIEADDKIEIREPIVKFSYKNTDYVYNMYNYKEMETDKEYILCLNDTYSAENSFYILGYGIGCFRNSEDIFTGDTNANPYVEKIKNIKKEGTQKYEN